MNDNETALNPQHRRISTALRYLMERATDGTICYQIESEWLLWVGGDAVVLQHHPSGNNYRVDASEIEGLTRYLWTAPVTRLLEAVRIIESFQADFRAAFDEAMRDIQA